MPQIEINNRSIGSEQPVYIIAEIGINHNGDIEIAESLIDKANEAGADAVKFQKRNLEETYVEETLQNTSEAELDVEYTVSNLKDVSLSNSDFKNLAKYARDRDLDFLCSPWDESSVEFLEKLDLPAYKVGSPDLTNFPLLEKIIETNKPVILSTGMSTDEEIEKTINFLGNKTDTAILHCKSTYPSSFENINLNLIEELREHYNVPVGYSGHEKGIAITEASVSLGASIIERHITLDKDMDGPDHSASLEPEEFIQLVENVRNIETSMGNKRNLTRGECTNKISLRKSLVAARNISKGQKIKREDITAKSPSKGISPQKLYDVIGKEVRRDLEEDDFIRWSDVISEHETSYETDIENRGVVVRFSDIDDHDWGNPEVMEFRLNAVDLEQDLDIGNYPSTRLTVHAPEQIGHEIVDPSALDEEKRRKAEEIIQKTIDKTREDLAPNFSDEFIPMIVIHPGGVSQEKLGEEKITKLNNSLEKTMENLDDERVKLVLENMPPKPWIFGGQKFHNNFMRAQEIKDYCKRNDQKICYDISHAALWCNYAGKNLEEHMKSLLPYIDYLHISDASGTSGEGLQIGEGEINWQNIGSLIKKLDVPMTTEIWRGHENSGEGFKKAAKRLEEILYEN